MARRGMRFYRRSFAEQLKRLTQRAIAESLAEIERALVERFGL